jgi:hypothetical protein
VSAAEEASEAMTLGAVATSLPLRVVPRAKGTCRVVPAHDVGAFLRCVGLEKLADAVEGPCGGVAQRVLELDKVVFDGVQVRRIFRQQEQLDADRGG